MVTAIGPAELESMNYRGLFAGMVFQEALERQAWEEGGGGLFAPAQRLTDFLAGKDSSTLPATSYKPGVYTSAISEWLPRIVYCVWRRDCNISDNGPKDRYRTGTLLGVETAPRLR